MTDQPKIDTEIEVDASPDEAWEAIATGEGLRRWFPLDARVKPGPGGSVWLSWGEGADWESPIEIWEPGRHLRTVDEIPGKDGLPPARVAVDYLIETRAGKTIVRLVHSGMAADTWEDEIDTLNAGWRAFLLHLQHSLGRHRGADRKIAHFRHPVVPITRPEAFKRTLRALGIADPDALAVGKPYEAGGSAGSFAGTVKLIKPPINFTGTVATLDDSMLLVEIEPGRGKCRPSIWLSLYGDAGKAAAEWTGRLQQLLETEFGGASSQ